MDISAAPEVTTQMPAVFCGPTADAAFFVALAVAVFGLYGIYKLLTDRRSRHSLESDEQNIR